MNLENVMEDWMGFVLVFLRRPLSWLYLLAPTFLRFLGAGFLQIFFTSAALFLSFFFFTSPKQNPFNANAVKSQLVQEPLQESPPLMTVKRLPVVDVSFLDESECFSQEQSSITEDSEFGETSSDVSDDGSISDEESLIELFLPNGHYKVEDMMKDDNNNNKSQMCLHKNIEQMELLAEFNDAIDEDNLIEIDISVGSIKCSRCTTEAA